MAWWGWMILGSSVILLVGVVLAALKSRKRGDGVDRLGLAENTAKTLQEEHRIEATASAEVAGLETSLTDKVETIHARHQKELRQSREEAEREQEVLATDTDALDHKLDSLLGVGSGKKEDP